jgi:hypothetical protein
MWVLVRIIGKFKGFGEILGVVIVRPRSVGTVAVNLVMLPLASFFVWLD